MSPRASRQTVAGVAALATSFAMITTAPQASGGAADESHTRPRALAVDARGDVLYVALSTANRVAVFDIAAGGARHVLDLPACAFPDALAALPGGGVVVSCRFDPGLRVVSRAAGAPERRAFVARVFNTGAEHGNRGLAVDDNGRFAYVGSPPRGGVKIVNLVDAGAPVRFIPTGASPQVVRLVCPDPAPSRQPVAKRILLVSNFIGHTVTVHAVVADGGLSAALQTIATEAPVLDLAVVPGVPGAAAGDLRGHLLLATHEDRPLSREHIAVEGLDSVLLALPRAPPGSAASFADAGKGKRRSINLTERALSPAVGLDAVAFDTATGRLAIVGAGSDNILLTAPDVSSLGAVAAQTVGANPSAVAFLPDGRVATADRLSDTVTFVAGPERAPRSVAVGNPHRSSPADRGEVLFFSRSLVPRNVATGPLSIYTCAACHADGHIDGRMHPSKGNRFYSATQTCRGLAGTEPFLTLGKPETFADFADNIVSTHAQGALDAPDSFDRYSVDLRLRAGDGAGDSDGWHTITLSPKQLRAALAAYMLRIPVEPSPFVAPGRRRFTEAEARGLATFRNNCAGCHRLAKTSHTDHDIAAATLEERLLRGEVALTSNRLFDVGTPVLGEGGNNPPSLRGVWAAAPYFSDASAATLEDLLRRTNPNVIQIHAAKNAWQPPAFSAATQADLLAFLRAL